MLNDERKAALAESLEQFQKQNLPQDSVEDSPPQPTQPVLPNAANPISHGNLFQSSDDIVEQPVDNNESVVRLGMRSILWHLRKMSNQTQDQVQPALALYSNCIMTDRTTAKVEPQIELVTFVTQEELQEHANDWCKEVEWAARSNKTIRQVKYIGISRETTRILLRDKGRILTRIRGRFSRCTIGIEKANDNEKERKQDQLRICAPVLYLGDIEQYATRPINLARPEEIVLDIPNGVNLGKLIGKDRRTNKPCSFSFKQCLLK